VIRDLKRVQSRCRQELRRRGSCPQPVWSREHRHRMSTGAARLSRCERDVFSIRASGIPGTAPLRIAIAETAFRLRSLAIFGQSCETASCQRCSDEIKRSGSSLVSAGGCHAGNNWCRSRACSSLPPPQAATFATVRRRHLTVLPPRPQHPPPTTIGCQPGPRHRAGTPGCPL